MSLTSLQELAFLLCAFYLLFRLARSIQSALASELAGIPGPFLARFSGTWSLWHQLNGRKFLAVHESFARFGSVLRAGPKTVYVSDFRLLGAVYQSKLDKVRLSDDAQRTLADSAPFGAADSRVLGLHDE